MVVRGLDGGCAGGGVPAAGDVDCDGVVTASDASALLQRVLNDSTKMPVEKTRSYMYIADADGDDMLTAADAAAVMQKVLDPGTSLAYDGKTYKEWLERKGTYKLDGADRFYGSADLCGRPLHKGSMERRRKGNFPAAYQGGTFKGRL